MALNAAIIFEVRPTVGADTNGGGFKAGATGTDWSQQTSPQYSVTDGVTAGTTTITSATANFGTDVVGNVIYVSGGSGSVVAGWYEITARASSTSITVDRSTGLTAGTGVTLKIGGALSTPGLAASLLSVSGIKAYVKNTGTSTMTTSTAGSGGPVVFPSNVNVSMEGYSATRGDLISPPTASAGAVTSITMFTFGGTTGTQSYINMKADANSGASNIGFGGFANPRHSVKLCIAANAVTGFTGTTAGCVALKCDADTCTTGFVALVCRYCTAKSCTSGFNLAGGANGGCGVHCVAYLCGTGFKDPVSAGSEYTNCTADACTVAGFNVTGSAGALLINCLSTNNTGGGIYGFNVPATCVMYYCAVYNNGTNINGTPVENVGLITLTADPYYSQAGADFRPNSTVGGGASLRAAGIGVYGQTNSIDVGAVHHGDDSPIGQLTGARNIGTY